MTTRKEFNKSMKRMEKLHNEKIKSIQWAYGTHLLASGTNLDYQTKTIAAGQETLAKEREEYDRLVKSLTESFNAYQVKNTLSGH